MIDKFINYCEENSLNLLKEARGHKILSLVGSYASEKNLTLGLKFQKLLNNQQALNYLIDKTYQELINSDLEVCGIKGVLLRNSFNYQLRDLADLDLLIYKNPYEVYLSLAELDCIITDRNAQVISQKDFLRRNYLSLIHI